MIQYKKFKTKIYINILIKSFSINNQEITRKYTPTSLPTMKVF